MKKLLSLISCLALCSGIHSQTLSAFKTNLTNVATLTITNGSIVNEVTTSNSLIQTRVRFHNNSSVTHTYTVFRTIKYNNPILDVTGSAIAPYTEFCFGFTAFPDNVNTPGPFDYTILAAGDNSYANATPFIIYLQEGPAIGLYSVRYKLMDVNNANDTLSFTVNYNGSVFIHENTMTESADIYPNPAYNAATIAFSLKTERVMKIKLYNGLGTLLYSSTSQNYSAGKHIQALDLGNYNSGLYFITATEGENTILFTKKIVKN